MKVPSRLQSVLIDKLPACDSRYVPIQMSKKKDLARGNWKSQERIGSSNVPRETCQHGRVSEDITERKRFDCILLALIYNNGSLHYINRKISDI
jgi:hypothetical protein